MFLVNTLFCIKCNSKRQGRYQDGYTTNKVRFHKTATQAEQRYD
jgi:hypothetical protein